MSLTFTTVRTQIGDFLGWGRSGWSDETKDRLSEIINAGHNQFVNSAIAPGETVAHRWSFLQPKAAFNTEASKWVYDLPLDYAGPVGDLAYSSDEDVHEYVDQTTPGMIDRNRAVYNYEGRPYLFALQPKNVAQTGDQVTQLLLYPTPDTVYGIEYHYHAKPVELSETNPYFLGGDTHSQTILQSCRDIAASRYNDDTGGPEHQAYLERLKASIEMDRRLSPKTVGVNNDGQHVTYTRHGTEFTVSMRNNLG